MSTSLQIPYIRNEKKWYLFSLFYDSENWNALIPKIKQLYQERHDRFHNCLFTFSKVKGEHIQVTLVTSIDDNNNYTAEIESYFQKFFNEFPSTRKTAFPYGSVIWCNYPNNSFVWNRFRLPSYTDKYIDFHQTTNIIVLMLLGNDFSGNDFFSTGLYLVIKGFCCLNDENQKYILSQLRSDIPLDLEMDSRITKYINKFDTKTISDTIKLYMSENEDEYSLELINWLNNVKDFLVMHDFKELCSFIFDLLLLNKLQQIVVFEFLNITFNRNKIY